MARVTNVFYGLTLFFGLSLNASAQNDSFWNEMPQMRSAEQSVIGSKQFNGAKAYELNIASLENSLSSLMSSQSISGAVSHEISLPLPSGELVLFLLKPTVVMEPALVEKYPSITVYEGHEVGVPSNQGRFDITPHGFHGMFNYNGQRIFIDPISLGNRTQYRVYDASKATDSAPGFSENLSAYQALQSRIAQDVSAKATFGADLRTYRIAVSAAGEYTAFHGGTKALALAAIVSTINRVNLVFNRDVAINLVLVGNNDDIIYTNSGTDPFDNDSSNDIDTNQTVIDTNIGSANYDIGHIFNTGGGGLAGLGVVCSSQKAEGVTGSPSPTGDSFDIDYVAHEIGHQFGGEHTFNGALSSCYGNGGSTSSFEPGSGSTIMAYAGICGAQNVQNNSDDYFHGYSIEQFRAFITTGGGASCGTNTTLGNQLPVANANNDFVIPAETPFSLTGSATDLDTDDIENLTFSWEQRDLGPSTSSAADMVDDGQRPLFRSFEPTTNPTRIFPKLDSIVANTESDFEILPTTNREMNFQLTVRDGNGGVDQDSTVVTVDNTTGPFVVTEPSINISAIGVLTSSVSWDVAGTDAGLVNCPNVDVSVSVDGGVSFEKKLLNSTNDGEADVRMPNVNTSQARVKVECSDGRFFNLSPVNFSITQSGIPFVTGPETISLSEDQSLTISLSDLSVEDIDSDFPQDFTLTVVDGENYSVDGPTLTPEPNYYGDLLVTYFVNDGDYDSPETSVVVSVNAVNDVPIAADDSYSIDRNSLNNVLLVLSNDVDVDLNDQISISGLSYSGSGSISISASNDSVMYTPGNNYSGQESFSYDIRDSAGLQSTANVTINVANSTKKGGALSLSMLLIVCLLGVRKTHTMKEKL
jgi:hypothetical protein